MAAAYAWEHGSTASTCREVSTPCGSGSSSNSQQISAVWGRHGSSRWSSIRSHWLLHLVKAGLSGTSAVASASVLHAAEHARSYCSSCHLVLACPGSATCCWLLCHQHQPHVQEQCELHANGDSHCHDIQAAACTALRCPAARVVWCLLWSRASCLVTCTFTQVFTIGLPRPAALQAASSRLRRIWCHLWSRASYPAVPRAAAWW